jgi:hypothetical protein
VRISGIDVLGIKGLGMKELDSEVERGGRFVMFTYTMSFFVITLRRPSQIHFIRAGESAVGRGMKYNLITMVMGWWGIPWGPIHSFISLGGNLSGGKDLTKAVCLEIAKAEALRRNQAALASERASDSAPA